MGASVQLGSTRGNIRNLPGNLNRKRAQTVAHMRPMPGQAHLLGDETAPQPSRKEVSKARHDFLDQQRQDAGGMGSLLPAASRSAEVATPIGLHAGDLPAAEMIPAAFAVGPKEHLATIASSTFIEVYEKRDVGLMSVLRYILMDGCAAERQGRLVGIKAPRLSVTKFDDLWADYEASEASERKTEQEHAGIGKLLKWAPWQPSETRNPDNVPATVRVGMSLLKVGDVHVTGIPKQDIVDIFYQNGGGHGVLTLYDPLPDFEARKDKKKKKKSGQIRLDQIASVPVRDTARSWLDMLALQLGRIEEPECLHNGSGEYINDDTGRPLNAGDTGGYQRQAVGEKNPPILAELLLSDARKLYLETKAGDNEERDNEANQKAKRKGRAKGGCSKLQSMAQLGHIIFVGLSPSSVAVWFTVAREQVFSSEP
ncbi:unnamed protein product [Symbiodinium microadriaticum]|nr:unnamed protein product [Symbiodinium sp. KB8]CAE7500711.1 unnamed protein product [Symbiodinium microadriaticum]